MENKQKTIKQKEISQEEVIELIIEKRFKHHIYLPKKVEKLKIGGIVQR